MISFVDPRGETATPVEPYKLGLEWPPSKPPVIGLLANGFPDSVEFLTEVAEVLVERVPGVSIRSWNKGNASAPASDQLLDGIAAEVGAVIAAYGH